MTSRGPSSFISGDERFARILAWAMAGLMLVFLAWPLGEILVKALQNHDGQFVGLQNLREVLTETRTLDAAWNSLAIAGGVTALVVPTALAFAYALAQARIPGRAMFKLIALSPLLTPSLMPAISLVYLFGNQGLLKGWLHGHPIYGPLGIVLGEAFYTFPYAVLVLATALSVADARLYEAAEVLGAGRLKKFLTVTLPNIRYGLISACLIVFTLVITDFGVPIVVGGKTNVLALEAYKQVLGQQNFQKGAAVGLVLLVPALVSFAGERWLARGRGGTFSGSSRPYVARRSLARNGLLWVLCAAVCTFLVAMVGTAVAASFIKLWPYKMNLTLAHYDFADMDGGGWLAFHNSLILGALTAVVGCAVVFPGPDPHGGARTGAGPGLRVLLQPSGQPPAPALRDHGHPGHLHGGALLHHRPPGPDDLPAPDRRGSGGGGPQPQAPLVDHLLPGGPAHDPARPAGRGPVPVRLGHDHGELRDLPLHPQDRAGLGGGGEHGRRRGCGTGRRHGHPHRGQRPGGHPAFPCGRMAAGSEDPGLAQGHGLNDIIPHRRTPCAIRSCSPPDP
jgi:ABC-type spermidine/putrescine transport system permease subunit II